MTYAGSETDHVNLDITAAKLKNSKEDVSTPKKVAQIVWTVAAGEAETK